jgi:hypothetical protein
LLAGALGGAFERDLPSVEDPLVYLVMR